MIWSTLQDAIFARVAARSGHLVVIARAGSGKTSTLIESARRLPYAEEALLTCYNKSIQRELARRCNGNSRAQTFHSIGYSAVAGVWGRLEIDNYRTLQVMRKVLGDQASADWVRQCADLVGRAKNALARSEEEIDSIIYEHCPEVEPAAVRPAVMAVMAECAKPSDRIDFDDMIWLPTVLDLSLRKWSTVFVDEVQDLNPAQTELVLRAVDRGGRIVAFGDPCQAIYAFRGADSAAVEKITDRLAASTLPLSVSYRCGRKIVAMARQYAADIEAAPGALDGEVVRRAYCAAEPGDFVLSRTNAPLATLALQMIRDDRPAIIIGRDLAKGLCSLVRRSKQERVEDFLSWVADYFERQRERLAAKFRYREIAALADKIQTIRVLAASVVRSADLIERIMDLIGEDSDGRRAVRLSTVHKAKGLEANRVWLLDETFAARPWQDAQEERNIRYVAITRACRSLYLVTPQEEES